MSEYGRSVPAKPVKKSKQAMEGDTQYYTPNEDINTGDIKDQGSFSQLPEIAGEQEVKLWDSHISLFERSSAII